jgi:bifunctional non-homologous end joining protein LigD
VNRWRREPIDVLQTYRTKRRFDVTLEPRGTQKRGKGNAFVIQKHAATRLHYDLRLELDGVMKSWAVTKGPSLVPGEKRLAVHVEDHPVEYNKFEGTIPKGEYGGGTVMIWDRGHWLPEGDPRAGYKKGHLSFRLEGEKLRGAWHLVRMRKRAREKHEPWLLIKRKDESARSARDPDILEEKPLSAATGRTLDEITEGKPRWKRSARQPGRQRETKRRTQSKRARKSPEEDDPAFKPSALPAFVPPCLATLTDAAPDEPGWVHEIKFDGYRMQARLDHRRVRLLTRHALDWTERFKPIATALAGLSAEQALIDGEIVSEDENGIAHFSLLQQDLKDGRYDRMKFYAFDLLHLDRRDLTPAPLIERKAALERLMSSLPRGAPLRFSEHSSEKGSLLLEHACRMSLEGILSKRSTAPYRPGRGRDWIKTKCSHRQEFVVVGYAPSTVDAKAIGALILGYYDDRRLRYAGRMGTGYSHQIARDLWQRLQPLRIAKTPFEKTPPEETRSRNAKWVEPRVVVEAAFHGWTHGDRIRQASFQGLREDKSPIEVVREDKPMATRMQSKAASRSGRSAVRPAPKSRPAQNKRSKANGYSVQLSHPDRVYWEDAGITKQGLADYYAQVWEWMAPHLVGRVLALVRCPEGATADCFFQKHARAGVDNKRLHLVPEPDGDESISVDNLDGLIALVQAGVLEIHTRGSTIDSLETCNRLVFDLDPGPGIGWAEIVSATREVRQLLADQGLTSFLKTTGGKGLHVVVPIQKAPWDIAKGFARSVAEQMAGDNPRRYTSTAAKRTRTGRIFVDYLRNSREATAIAPYSTRARPGATVSVPISWEELGTQTSANRYTVLNLHQRLAHLRRDPWADIGQIKQALPARNQTVRSQ